MPQSHPAGLGGFSGKVLGRKKKCVLFEGLVFGAIEKQPPVKGWLIVLFEKVFF